MKHGQDMSQWNCDLDVCVDHMLCLLQVGLRWSIQGVLLSVVT